MDFKQQNGQPQYPRSSSRLKHQSSTASSISSSSASPAPQKMSLRRRCHSESLPMAPMHETRSGKSRLHHHNNHHQQLKSKGENTSLLIESFSLQGNCRKPLPLIGNNDLLPNITVKSAKENVMHNGHPRFDGSVNAKDVYMNDLDAYRRDRRNGNYLAGDRQLESRFARNLESSFNPRNTIFDRSNRKLRPRSESEPHDIYNSTSMITTSASGGRITPAWSNREHMRDVSVVFYQRKQCYILASYFCFRFHSKELVTPFPPRWKAMKPWKALLSQPQ